MVVVGCGMPGKGVGYRKDGAVVKARAIRFWWIHTSIHTSSCHQRTGIIIRDGPNRLNPKTVIGSPPLRRPNRCNCHSRWTEPTKSQNCHWIPSPTATKPMQLSFEMDQTEVASNAQVGSTQPPGTCTVISLHLAQCL